MGRVLTDSINDNIISLLEKLVDKTTESQEYAQTMYSLGNEFGALILDRIMYDENIVLASTVEDADYLGKGIIDVLEKYGKKVFLTVFWNKRFNPSEENNIAIAPIVKEFHETQNENIGTVIIIKSIISSSCVVRTNLTKLIEESSPRHILIVAPVLLRGATENLESEFSDDIKSRFNYLYFAEDDQKSDDGFVYPGIGGDVYQRLGFESQKEKNSYVPKIVKERRYK
jgi:hypothetical protein